MFECVGAGWLEKVERVCDVCGSRLSSESNVFMFMCHIHISITLTRELGLKVNVCRG